MIAEIANIRRRNAYMNRLGDMIVVQQVIDGLCGKKIIDRLLRDHHAHVHISFAPIEGGGIAWQQL